MEYKHWNQWTGHESREEPGHTILGEIGSTAAAGISSPGLRIRVRLSSEQFEAEEAGWTRPRFRVLVSSQLVTWRLCWPPIGQLRPLMASDWRPRPVWPGLRCWGRAIYNQPGQDNSGTLAKVMQYFAITCGTLQLSGALQARQGPGLISCTMHNSGHSKLHTTPPCLASGLSGSYGDMDYSTHILNLILAGPLQYGNVWKRNF